MSIFSARKRDVPEWESSGGLTMADALAQCVIAYGPTGFAEVRVRADSVSALSERRAAREALAAMPPEPRWFQEEDFPTTPVAEFRRMQRGQHDEHEAWHKKHRELSLVAYPFEYVVGSGDNISFDRGRREYTGMTWEEALAKAKILGATKRLDRWQV